MKFFSMDKLMQVVRHRGYVTEKAVADALSPIFGLSVRSTENKIRMGKLSKEECEVIGAYFEMTMKEYYDVFMQGLFVEDNEGHFVCHIDDLRKHLFIHKPDAMKRKHWKTKEEQEKELLEKIDKL